MSPEAVRLNQFNAASDVWALGCTIIELLTGKPPLWSQFKHLNGYQILYQLTHMADSIDLTQFNLSPSLLDFL
jgi:serine/threonine protein kinase